jgi:hypothetical protein
MRKLLSYLILSICLAPNILAQDINGEIMSNRHNLTVVKVWGTHYERGYAAGYLLADKFTDAYENYIAWAFGPYLPYAKMLITSPYFFYIDPEYVEEAEAFIQGVHAAGYGAGLDFADVLVGNCFLDIQGVLAGLASMNTGCSSLMSWGAATQKTDLNGKSMITRHLDWDIIPILLRNQVMVIHIPMEENEQPWLLVGFAGQISVMSGVNQSGVAIMHQSMNDLVTPGSPYRAYEPITFSMRRAIERRDLNGDGVNNVQDIKTALTQNPYGFANNYIITGLAPSNAGNDEDIAIVAEVANTAPYYSIRHNTYPGDRIPGQNLYAANACIARNNALNFCDRYNNIVAQIGDGAKLSSKRSWDMMKNYSVLPGRNLQFIQFIPELHSLKLGVHQMDGTIASQAPTLRFNTISLFNQPQKLKMGTEELLAMELEFDDAETDFLVFPNPARELVQVSFGLSTQGSVNTSIYNILGERVFHQSIMCNKGPFMKEFDLSGLPQGTYFLRVNSPDGMVTRKISILR